MFNKVLSMLPVIISQGSDSLWFWMWQSFGYTRVLNTTSSFECVIILNISAFWIRQGYRGFRICLNNSWLCLDMPEYAWIGLICLNGLCLTFSNFSSHSPICFTTVPFLLEHEVTYLNIYSRLQVIVVVHR